MSTYTKTTKHPKTGEWEEALWVDDFFGRHYYGVVFPSDRRRKEKEVGHRLFYPEVEAIAYDPEKTELETRDTEEVDSPSVEVKKESTRYQLTDGRYKVIVDVYDSGEMTITPSGREEKFTFWHSKPQVVQAIGRLIQEAGKLGDVT